MWLNLIFFRVEEYHSGKETNTVLYIPTGPDCPNNRSYVEKTKACFTSGECPPDFGSSSESDFQDRVTIEDLSDVAKVMMGFENEWWIIISYNLPKTSLEEWYA